MIKTLVFKYFDAFAFKKKKELFDMLSEDVSLVDWEIVSHGKDKVVQSFEEIWRNLSDINLNVKRIDLAVTMEQSIAYCHIKISAPEIDKSLDVIDVIEFDDSGKITLIEAYKR